MGTYIPNKQTRQQTQKLRVQRTEAYAQRVKREYEQAVNSILALKTSVPDLPTGQMYSFDGDTKKVQRQVNVILRQLHSATLTTIKTGVETEWEQANKEVDSLLRSALGKKAVENPDLAGWFSRNKEAMDAFLNRSNEGMNLSDRVWKNTRQLRDEMEVAMTVAIGEGQRASAMSRRVRQYLNDPDLMFRRFRYKDEDGNWQLKWKKRVMDDNGRYHFVDYDRNSYKVGAGNYKSSYKNAMRLTRTETNMAYRRADHDRWQGMEFVLGQKIETSNAHDPKEDKDICDELAGNYPKEFVFDGWHPQCMCMCTAIMVSEDEMVARMQARLRGEEYQFKEKSITAYPKGFRDFVKNNRQNIIDAQERGKQPYFLANNAGVVNDILGKKVIPDTREEDKTLVLSTLEKAKIRQSQRTPQEIKDIQDRWKESRNVNKELSKLTDTIPNAYNLIGEYSLQDLKQADEFIRNYITPLQPNERDIGRLRRLIEINLEKERHSNETKLSQDFKAARVIEDAVLNRLSSLNEKYAELTSKNDDFVNQCLAQRAGTLNVVSSMKDLGKAQKSGSSFVVLDRTNGYVADEVLHDTASRNWLQAKSGERNEIYGYTAKSSWINEPLHNLEYGGEQTRKEFEDKVNNITSYIGKNKLPTDMILQRGDSDMSVIAARLKSAGNKMPADLKDLIGLEMKEEGFMSTTCSLGNGYREENGCKVITYIYAPKGTKGAYVEPISFHGGQVHELHWSKGIDWNGTDRCRFIGTEDELTLQRGTASKITHVKEENGVVYLFCEITDQQPMELSKVADRCVGKNYR